MKPFRELSRCGRLRRFRELASMALAAYNLAEADLSFIQYGENVTYRVDAPGFSVTTGNEGSYIPNRYLLRIHAVGDVDGIASEFLKHDPPRVAEYEPWRNDNGNKLLGYYKR